MQFLNRIIPRKFPPSLSSSHCNLRNYLNLLSISNPRLFSTSDAGGGGGGGDGGFPGWNDDTSTWSTGITKELFDGEVVGHQITPPPPPPSGGGGIVNPPQAEDSQAESRVKRHIAAMKRGMKLDGVGNWEKREKEMFMLMKQIENPGTRGSYLKDSEKTEMFRKHRENPEVYTVEKLAQEYRVLRQRVMAILWLKEQEEVEEVRRGEPLDDGVELLIDTFPDFFNYHDREYHVSLLPHKPDFKVMPEDWDGTTIDPDELHYEISKREDDLMYEEFARRFTFNTMKFKNQVKVHKYSRRRPSNGWDFVVEVLGPRGKRGAGGGWKFTSRPDGSTRPLNSIEKLYLKRETVRRRRKWTLK